TAERVATEFSYSTYYEVSAPRFAALGKALQELPDAPAQAIEQVFARGDGAIVVNWHTWSDSRSFVERHAADLKANGVDTVYYELPHSDLQDYLDIFHGSGRLFPPAEKYLRSVDKAWGRPKTLTLAMFKAALENEIRVVFIDDHHAGFFYVDHLGGEV